MSSEPIGYRHNPCAECADRRRPYVTNPARRLRRIKRWMAMLDKAKAHEFTSFNLHPWHFPKFGGGAKAQQLVMKRHATMARLTKIELAWAVETAAKAIGGTDV